MKKILIATILGAFVLGTACSSDNHEEGREIERNSNQKHGCGCCRRK